LDKYIIAFEGSDNNVALKWPVSGVRTYNNFEIVWPYLKDVLLNFRRSVKSMSTHEFERIRGGIVKV
jgi:hypothetical protein